MQNPQEFGSRAVEATAAFDRKMQSTEVDGGPRAYIDWAVACASVLLQNIASAPAESQNPMTLRQMEQWALLIAVFYHEAAETAISHEEDA
jgi:hypothetical protein